MEFGSGLLRLFGMIRMAKGNGDWPNKGMRRSYLQYQATELINQSSIFYSSSPVRDLSES